MIEGFPNRKKNEKKESISQNESTLEVINNLRLKAAFNKKQEITEYRGETLEGKKIVIRKKDLPPDFKLDPFKGYSVQVRENTRPDQPGMGVLVSTIIEEEKTEIPVPTTELKPARPLPDGTRDVSLRNRPGDVDPEILKRLQEEALRKLKERQAERERERFRRLEDERIQQRYGQLEAERRIQSRLDDPFRDSFESSFDDDPFPDDDFDSFSDENEKDLNAERDLKHREALRDRVQHLRRSVPFQALSRMLQDPELRHEYDTMLSRRKEILALQRGDEKHRALTPMLVGLMMGKRTRPLLDMAIDETVENRSRNILELLDGQRRRYVAQGVIGSGVHAAIWNVNRQMIVPSNPALTFERDMRIGGQFAQMQSPLFRKNNRVRKMLRDEPALPGTAQTLSTFSDYAATSPADTSMEAYPHQSSYGEHARINQFLSGETLTGADVRHIRKPYGGLDRALGNYVVGFVDKRGGRVVEVEIDRVIFTTGIGEEKITLNQSDAGTRNILVAEKEEYENGNDAKVMSFAQAARRLSDPENPFPMKGIKNLVVSGEGDGMKVIVGVILGYESQVGMSTTQLDFVERIDWIGQSFPTKEAFVEGCRVRYHQLALEFPREKIESYYHRIYPHPGLRAERLERDGNNIMVVATGKDGGVERFYGDHYVYAHGFEDKTDKLVEFTDPERLSFREDLTDFLSNTDRLLRVIRRDPVAIVNQEGDRVELREKEGLIESVTIDSFGYIENKTFNTQSEFLAYIEGFRKNLDDVLYIDTARSRQSARTEAFSVPEINDGLPVASRYIGTEIYKVGPAAGLALTEQEKRRAPALENIPENTASVFRYADYDAELSRYFANQDSEVGAFFDDLREEFDSKERFTVTGDGPYKNFSFRTEEMRGVPHEIPATDLLRFGLGSRFEGFRTIATFDSLELSLKKVSIDDYVVSCNIGVSRDLRNKITNAFSSGYSGAAIKKLVSDGMGSRAEKELKITIPFTVGNESDGKRVDTARIRYEIVK